MGLKRLKNGLQRAKSSGFEPKAPVFLSKQVWALVSNLPPFFCQKQIAELEDPPPPFTFCGHSILIRLATLQAPNILLHS